MIPFVLDSNDFVFDSQVIVQAIAFGFRVGEIAAPTGYFQEVSSVGFRRSVIYGLSTLKTLVDCVLDPRGLNPQPMFRRRLNEVISRDHRQRLFRSDRDGNSGEDTPAENSLELEL